MRSHRTLASCLISAAAFAGVAAPHAHAYLGGFENADGYAYAFTYPVLDNWVDCTMYNAGAFGPNAGGGSPFQQTVNTGLWTYSSSVGAAFTNPAQRILDMGAAPTFNLNSISISNTVPSYFVGAHFGGRLGTNALAIRNATPAGTGAMKYDYRLDSYDFGGVAPASITSGNIPGRFFFQANPLDNIVDATGMSPEKLYLSFKDSSGNIGFQWGYQRDNTIIWRASPSGSWNTTALVADDGSGVGNYDGVQFSINLTTQTFGLRYFDVSTSTTTVLAPLGTPLGNTMSDFTHIGWYFTDNVVSGVGGKNFFDDFTFQVPEPTTLMTTGAVGVAALARRRRRCA
jgi:hypothetical protein